MLTLPTLLFWGGGGGMNGILLTLEINFKFLKNCLQPSLPWYLACWLIFFTSVPQFYTGRKKFY